MVWKVPGMVSRFLIRNSHIIIYLYQYQTSSNSSVWKTTYSTLLSRVSYLNKMSSETKPVFYVLNTSRTGFKISWQHPSPSLTNLRLDTLSPNMGFQVKHGSSHIFVHIYSAPSWNPINDDKWTLHVQAKLPKFKLMDWSTNSFIHTLVKLPKRKWLFQSAQIFWATLNHIYWVWLL